MKLQVNFAPGFNSKFVTVVQIPFLGKSQNEYESHFQTSDVCVPIQIKID